MELYMVFLNEGLAFNIIYEFRWVDLAGIDMQLEPEINFF